MNIIYAGTPDFAVPTLEKLYNNNYNIPLVITQKDRRRGRGKKVQFTPVKEKAVELNIEVFQPDNINSEESINKLKSLKPDLIVVVAFGQILRKYVLEIPRYGCINVHASLLPKYRGAAPINWAIINGETKTGVTIMDMEEGLDSGDILKQIEIPITEEDHSLSIYNKLSTVGGDLLISVIKDIQEGTIKRIPQNKNLATYAPMIFKETGKIDWNQESKDIVNLVRGLKPWPGAYTNYNGEIVKIHQVKIGPNLKEGNPGEIIKVSNNGIYVRTLDSSIIIEELQFPNKRKMNTEEYLAGNSIKLNTVLV